MARRLGHAGDVTAGETRDGSRVHCDSHDRGGARLCPSGLATATPQPFTVASWPLELDGFGVDSHTTNARKSCAADRPIPTRLEPASLFRSFDRWFAHTAPSDLARRARTVWQSRHALPSSGPLATHHRGPRQSAAPELRSGRCDGPKETVSHHLSINPAPRGAQFGREESRRGLQNCPS